MDNLVWFTSKLNDKQSFIGINKMYLEAFEYDYDLTIYFQQIMFWSSGKSSLGVGEFYKKSCEFGHEIGFSREKINRLKRKLNNHELGEFISTKAKKIAGTPVTHYKADFNAISEWFYQEFKSSKTNNGKFESEQSMESSKTNSPSYTDPNHILTNNSEPSSHNLVNDFSARESLTQRAFDYVFTSWKETKKSIGKVDTSPEGHTYEKNWKPTFNKTYFKTHTEQQFKDEVNKIVEFCKEAHSVKGFNRFENMQLAKFLSEKQWRDE